MLDVYLDSGYLILNIRYLVSYGDLCLDIWITGC